MTNTFNVVPNSIPNAGSRSVVDSASDSGARGPGFDTWSGHILSILHPPIQDGQLSATDESMSRRTG